LLLSDSTVKLEVSGGGGRPPDPPGNGGGAATAQKGRLLTYHGSQGLPLPQHVPAQPIQELCWNARYQVRKLLGHGAQGVVYLAKREGVDGYFTNVALKIFYRNPSLSSAGYLAEMSRIALQAQRVSRLQHDHLISIRDFVALGETRVMVLEWIDGLDLARLLDLRRLEKLRHQAPKKVWERLNDVIVNPGEDHCRVKPGIAVDILRGCLAGLSPLHNSGIVHCDLKPSNIMVKRTGTKKIIDIDSSCVPEIDPPHLRGTPYYMAPEALRAMVQASSGSAGPAGKDREKQSVQVQSDIASLGYLLIEMLTGRLLFKGCESTSQLLEAKLSLPGRLEQILPREVCKNAILLGLVNKMVAVEPRDRFLDADAAELDRTGAVSFHRQLVKTDLSTEYARELAWWLELLDQEPAQPA
jgi:serine/threonine protein kinase